MVPRNIFWDQTLVKFYLKGKYTTYRQFFFNLFKIVLDYRALVQLDYGIFVEENDKRPELLPLTI